MIEYQLQINFCSFYLQSRKSKLYFIIVGLKFNEDTSSEITAVSILADKVEENNDASGTAHNDTTNNSTKKSITLAHENLSRKKGLLVQNISEIFHNTELTACSNDFLNGKAYNHTENHGNIDTEECKPELKIENSHNDKENVTLDAKHKLVSLQTCKQSLKDNDSAASHSNSACTLLKTSSDNSKDSTIDCGTNLLTDGLTSLSLNTFKESSDLPCTSSSTSANFGNAIDDLKVSSNSLDNNNENLLENATDGNKLAISSEPICKETLTLQDMGCTSLCNDSASTSKPFKLPILEKISKTANIQQPEIEENAVALLEPSLIRQEQLEEVRCLDLEPRSSNSSEESNSDIESQHAASTSHNDIKKVGIYFFL